MIKNRVFALVYRIIAFVVSLFGVLWATGMFKGEFHGVILLYYTIQSNLLVVAMFGALVFKTTTDLIDDGVRGENGHFPRLSAAVLLAVMLTLIVFWLVLAPVAPPELSSYFATFDNLSVHLICPLLMLGDYVMFSRGGKLKKVDPLLFATLPITYLIKTLIIGFTGNVAYSIPGLTEPANFPYFFLDYNEVGLWMLLFIVGIAAAYVAFGYLMLFIDRKRKGAKRWIEPTRYY
jgi:hypothetical protein